MKHDAQTIVCCLIGDPVDHSLSPSIHNAAYVALGLNYMYTAFRVTKLQEALGGIRALGIRGVSVTAPHKTRVMAYLDEIDETAQIIGAVNTIVHTDGILKGYNTDSSCAIAALEEKIILKGKRIVLLGAGGAARAIAYGLEQKGSDVLILN